jgi:hypothetical protein
MEIKRAGEELEKLKIKAPSLYTPQKPLPAISVYTSGKADCCIMDLAL